MHAVRASFGLSIVFPILPLLVVRLVLSAVLPILMISVRFCDNPPCLPTISVTLTRSSPLALHVTWPFVSFYSSLHGTVSFLSHFISIIASNARIHILFLALTHIAFSFRQHNCPFLLSLFDPHAIHFARLR